MKKIAIWAVKGGVGKSTITARLGLAFRDQGLKVGFFDADITGSTLATILGIRKPYPRVGLDTANQKMLPVKIDGYEIFDLVFRFESTLIWEGGERRIKSSAREYQMRGTGRVALVAQLLRDVTFSSDLDYLLLDMPPGLGDEVQTLFANIQGLTGALLVCQPTKVSIEDIDRNLDMAKFKQIPLLGMVGNMTETICPGCGLHDVPFEDAGVDLKDYCKGHGIPYLASIPLTADVQRKKPLFYELAGKIAVAQPVKIWERSLRKKLEDAVLDASIWALLK